ncbi:hypothetical protein Bca4012_051297 [Brassica carinata]
MSGIGRSLKGRGGGRGSSRGGGRGATRGGSQAVGVNSFIGRSYSPSNPRTSKSSESVSLPATHQTQNPHPPPRQNPVTLDDLLAIPGREHHLPVLSLVPKEGTTCFGTLMVIGFICVQRLVLLWLYGFYAL